MFKFLLGLLILLLAWELALLRPAYLMFSFLLAASASFYLSFLFVPPAAAPQGLAAGWRRFWPDRLLFIVFNLSFFWWLLWVDFRALKYLIPIFSAFALLYFFTRVRRPGQKTIPPQIGLVLFLGGVFFTAAAAFGLETVLGWPLWAALFIFTAALAILALPAANLYEGEQETLRLGRRRSFLIILLLGAEFFSALVWLPFTEFTLALFMTLALILAYDFLKYYLRPELIRTRIIVKKAFVYSGFLLLLLALTPWF